MGASRLWWKRFVEKVRVTRRDWSFQPITCICSDNQTRTTERRNTKVKKNEITNTINVDGRDMASCLKLFPFQRPYFRWIWVSRYQNISILDVQELRMMGGDGDNWSCKTIKALVKSSPPTNQHPAIYRSDALPVAQPTVSEH